MDYRSASVRTFGQTPALHSVFRARASTPPPESAFARPRGARAARTMPASPDRAQGPLVPSLLLTRIAACATPDLLFQRPDKTLATYVQNS
jgi:hypothetical protein